MKRIHILLLGFVIALSSCGEDEQIKQNQFKVDAYIRGMYVKGKVSYAPVLIATSDLEVKTPLFVTDLQKNKYILENYWESKTKFRWVPDEENFSEKFSEEEVYSFSIPLSQYERKEDKKRVSLSEVPAPFKIESLTYDKNENSLEVTWKNVNATAYVIFISRKINDYPLFQSFQLTVDDAEAEILKSKITLSDFKWFSNPTAGKKYILSIHAFNFVGKEDITGEFVATREITWGK